MDFMVRVILFGLDQKSIEGSCESTTDKLLKRFFGAVNK